MSSVILFAPKRFEDSRGWFVETYNARREARARIEVQFVQDNLSWSETCGTIRGIHFQLPPHAQSKLVRCTRGRLMDYAVDLRSGSPTYGQYVAAELSANNQCQLFIPAGFGHAFITLEAQTEILYKVDDYYAPQCDAGIKWDSPELGIDWPLNGPPILSDKDRSLPMLGEFVSPFEYDGSSMQFIDLRV